MALSQFKRSALGYTLGVLGIILMLPASAWAAPILPPGINPGDTYQLAFVTSTTRSGSSSNIADYNTHVQNAANAAGIGIGSTFFGSDVTWKAIASTTAIDARDNALVVGEVYNLAGTKVADTFADFWDGTHDTRIDFDENVQRLLGRKDVWTGTQPDGTGFRELGNASAFVGAGLADQLDRRWVQNINLNVVANPALPLYALSEPLTVPTAVPVPSSLLLFGSGLAAFVCWRKWSAKKI